MISNSEIRAKAREVLGRDIFKGAWLYPVLVLFVISAISGAVSFTYVGPIILAGILACASATYFLSRVRGEIDPENIGACVDGVKNDITGSMVVGILTNLFVSLATILFVIPGIVLSCSYALVYFIRKDNPGIGFMDSLKESQRMMKGHKMQYFTLQLSFIGWIILGSLCLGVGSLWASAYVSTANAVFYEEIVALEGGRVSEETEV